MSDPLIEDTAAGSLVANLKSNGRFPGLRSPLGRFGWFVVLLMAIFSKPLASLIAYVATSNLHSYIVLVPFISGYLIYVRRNQLPKSCNASPGIAAAVGLLGLAATVYAFVFGAPKDIYLSLVACSFFCFVMTGGFLFLGRRWMAAAAFPLALLIFIVPLPNVAADALETASMLASTEAADFFFNLTGTPTIREGTIFQLPNIAIQVGQECSGIRSSLVLVLTSLVAANLFLKSGWRRAILIAFVIPLGIIRNGFRVWTIGTLCMEIGPQMIHSIIHRRGGPVFFALSLIPLFLLACWLRKGELKGENQRTEGG